VKNTKEEQIEEYRDNIEEHRSFKPSSLIDNDDDYCSSGYNLYFPGGRLEIQREISLAILLMHIRLYWISLRG
jgi:hypothetical protein